MPVSIGYEIIYPPGCKELSDNLTKDELRKRLNELSICLDRLIEEDASKNEQTFDNDSSALLEEHSYLKGLFMLLCSMQYVNHTDTDIRLRVGSVICKFMKLFCPHNPFSGMLEEATLTKDLLCFLLNSISHLGNIKSKTDIAYPKLHTILYISLQIDIFLWCSSLDDQSVLLDFVKTIFGLLKNINIWAWTETSATRQSLLDVLAKVLSHANSLSREVIAYILQFLIEPAKSTMPEQHTFARDLIIRCTSQLEYPIQMLLQNSLIAGAKDDSAKVEHKPAPAPQNEENHHEDQAESADSDNEDESLRKHIDPLGEHAFLIIYALHTIQESIVAPVLPTVELKLKSPSVRDRKRAFRLLARLFSEPNSLLHRKNSGLWDAFLGRFNDIDTEVRKLCVHMVPQLLKQNPDLPLDKILECFRQRVLDPDEEVRLLALRTLSSLVNESQDDVSDEIFELLRERTRDKTLSIRKEASSALASLYKRSLQNEQFSERLPIILNTIMRMYYHNSLDDKIIVERLFKSCLVPYHFETGHRMRALFTCYGLMDETSIKAIQEMFKIQFTVISLVREILKLLVDQQNKKISNEVNTELMDRLKHLSSLLPKSDRSVEHLKRFFNMIHTNKVLRGQLVKLTKVTCTCSQAAAILRDMLKKITTGQSGTTTSDNMSNYTRIVKILLERSAPVLFDRALGQELLTQVVILKETNSLPGIIGSVSQIRALRLLLALAVYFREILPSDEVMDYLLSVSTDESEKESEEPLVSEVVLSNTTDVEPDPYTVHELVLNILCCILGGGPKGSKLSNSDTTSSSDMNQHNQLRLGLTDGQFTPKSTQLSERTEELLPLLKTFCCTGIKPPSIDHTDPSQPSSSSSSEPVKRPRGRPAQKHQTSAKQPDTQSEQLRIAQSGLAWRRERRRAKLAVRVLFCLLNVVRRLAGPRKKSSLVQKTQSITNGNQTNNQSVDLDELSPEQVNGNGQNGADGDEDDDDDMNGDMDNEDEEMVELERKITETLDSIVETCLTCTMDSPNYVTCLTTLGQIALLLPGLYNRELKNFITKSIVQEILANEPPDDDPSKSNHVQQQDNSGTKSSSTHVLSEWTQDGLVSLLTRAKISAIKLMTNWLFGLKSEVKSVAQAVIRLLHRIIIHDGDLTKKGKLPMGEMSRMRLVAATSWLKLANSQSYVECIEIEWYQSMTYIMCDPCPQVRSHFLTKLHQGLYRLRLPLEYMAMFAHASEVNDTAFRQRAKQLLVSNIQRRRTFLSRYPSYLNDAKFLFALLPDYVLPYLIYLLAHDPEWTVLDNLDKLNKLKNSLWFIMEPIVLRGDNYGFLRKVIEKIKHACDALNPDNALANNKLYIVADISLGLLLTRCPNPTMKEYPVDVKLPKVLFAHAAPEFQNPDFKQLIDLAKVNPANMAGPNSVSPEAPVKNILQFTPNKRARAFKEDFMPPQLIKLKTGTSKSKAQDEEPVEVEAENPSKKGRAKPSPKAGPSRSDAGPTQKQTKKSDPSNHVTIETETLEVLTTFNLNPEPDNQNGQLPDPTVLPEHVPDSGGSAKLTQTTLDHSNTPKSPIRRLKRSGSVRTSPNKRKKLDADPADSQTTPDVEAEPTKATPKGKSNVRKIPSKSKNPSPKKSPDSKHSTTGKKTPKQSKLTPVRKSRQLSDAQLSSPATITPASSKPGTTPSSKSSKSISVSNGKVSSSRSKQATNHANSPRSTTDSPSKRGPGRPRKTEQPEPSRNVGTKKLRNSIAASSAKSGSPSSKSSSLKRTVSTRRAR